MTFKAGDLCRLKPVEQRDEEYDPRGELVLVLNPRGGLRNGKLVWGYGGRNQALIYRFNDSYGDGHPNPGWLARDWLVGLYEVVG